VVIAGLWIQVFSLWGLVFGRAVGGVRFSVGGVQPSAISRQ
jgi:hypothetical protein